MAMAVLLLKTIAAQPNKINQPMKLHSNPTWWTEQHDSSWERVKAAFKRDWDQTKHDFGGNRPDTDQDVGNTVRQATGKEAIPPRGVPAFEEYEPAYKFGYGARSKYRGQYTQWNKELETQLREDWGPDDWDDNLPHIRRGWDYQK
jgi:hypothetical protein